MQVLEFARRGAVPPKYMAALSVVGTSAEAIAAVWPEVESALRDWLSSTKDAADGIRISVVANTPATDELRAEIRRWMSQTRELAVGAQGLAVFLLDSSGGLIEEFQTRSA